MDLESSGRKREEEEEDDLHIGSEEEQRFEKWVRDVLYRKRKDYKSMQAVKSRMMYGSSISMVVGFVFLFMALRASYSYKMTGPMRVRRTGASLSGLLYGKAILSLLLGAVGLWAWFRRMLLRKDVVKVYVAIRLIDWLLTVWLFVATLVDFGKWSSVPSGEKAIYFVSLLLCVFCLFNIYENLRILRKHWKLFRVQAIRAFRSYEKVEVIRGNDPMITEVYPLVTPSAPAHVVPQQPQPVEPISNSYSYPYDYQPLEYFQGTESVPQSARTQASVPDIDIYARMSYDEYLLRWRAMAESGQFERFVEYIPTPQEMAAHLAPKGFQLVFADTTEDEEQGPLLHMYVFAQSQGAVFLVEFLFNINNQHVQATFKSQDEEKSHKFISLLELQHILY